MLTVNRKNLLNALAAIKPAINKKSALPILVYVKATYADGKLTIEATNLELYAARSVPSTGDDTPWPVHGTCLEYAALEAALKGRERTVNLSCVPLRDTDLALHATVKNGSATFRVPTLAVDEFPPAPPVLADPEHWLVVNRESFVDTFGRIAIATSTDEARPVLTGVHMRTDKDGTLAMEAADGFRLLRTRYTPKAHSESFECNVPYRAGKLLDKLTSDLLHIAIDTQRNALIITGDNGERIASQLIDGNYPDLTQVIPVKPPHRVSFLAAAALDALAPYRALMGILRVTYADGKLLLAVRTEEHDIETSLPCILRSDDFMADVIGFNPDYLRSIVQAMHRKGEDVVVEVGFNIPTTPARFTTPAADPDFVAALMPMHIG